MNLHIVPDNTFVNRFYDNLSELNLLENNRIIVRANGSALKSVQRDLPFAPLYSSNFSLFAGDTQQYDKVFIHYLTPFLYRWIALNNFNQLNWVVWGGDLYNLPGIDRFCYEPLTYKHIKWSQLVENILYQVKVFTTQSPFKKKAYAKVENILTWMTQEYDFAKRHLPVKANHQFFFYENSIAYDFLSTIKPLQRANGTPKLIVGNSGSATNNHFDAINFLEKNKVKADLIIPVSYGDSWYIKLLKKKLSYSGGTITFLEGYLPFEEYLKVLALSDGLIMNTIRPQGYGNIFLMLYLKKPVFFNEKNVSLLDLTNLGFPWHPLSDLSDMLQNSIEEREMNQKLFSHDSLLRCYKSIFS